MADLTPILNWAVNVLEQGGTPHLATLVSLGVRLCETATRAGISLAGVQMTVGGEPSTPGRLAAIQRSGAWAIPSYGSTEASPIAKGCLAPRRSDDLHLFDDCVALIPAGPTAQTGTLGPGSPSGSRPSLASAPAGLPPDALLLTSLRPTARFILLNTSLGDSAVVSRESCGCPMEQFGWTTHLHTVRSFEKLTAGGMTFHDTDVIGVLEVVLPGRFGGGPTDYQLVEEEGPTGEPRVRLLVHPRLGPVDELSVEDAFLEALGQGSGAHRVMELMWRQAGLLKVEREPPRATAEGKILHLHSSLPAAATAP